MLTFTNIEQPHIDIELYGTDTYISPIDKVHIMDEDTFEQFTLEWLYGSKKAKYSSIQRIGGSGDKGRDIIGYYSDGSVDYFQCKHYHSALAPSNYYLELGKLCYYTFKKEIPIPNNYYIIASNDIGPSLSDYLDNPSKLQEALLNNWNTHCKDRITNTSEILLENSFKNYIESFNFSIVKSYPMSQVIDEYLNTIYGNIRFGGRHINLPKTISPPKKPGQDELPYISALLESYSDELGVKIDTTESLKAYKTFFNHLNRQRKDYYSIETIRRFVRDTLTDSKQIDILKEEIYNGIIDTHEQIYDSGYKRLVADLQQAAQTNTSKCLLDSKLCCIGNSERKGTCHMLVNEHKLKWVDDNE